jgi:hypothetical protein
MNNVTHAWHPPAEDRPPDSNDFLDCLLADMDMPRPQPATGPLTPSQRYENFYDTLEKFADTEDAMAQRTLHAMTTYVLAPDPEEDDSYVIKMLDAKKELLVKGIIEGIEIVNATDCFSDDKQYSTHVGIQISNARVRDRKSGASRWLGEVVVPIADVARIAW